MSNEITQRKQRRSQLLEHLYEETYRQMKETPDWAGFFTRKSVGDDLGFTEFETEEAIRDLVDMGLVERIAQSIQITIAGKLLVENC